MYAICSFLTCNRSSPIRMLISPSAHDKLMCFVNYTEMARVTGVPFNYLLSRGQQIKVISQLFRKANEDNYLIPALAGQGMLFRPPSSFGGQILQIRPKHCLLTFLVFVSVGYSCLDLFVGSDEQYEGATGHRAHPWLLRRPHCDT